LPGEILQQFPNSLWIYARRRGRGPQLRGLSAIWSFELPDANLQVPQAVQQLRDHIRARRLDLNLLQKRVADQIGVHEITITRREGNATIPEVRYNRHYSVPGYAISACGQFAPWMP